MKKTSENKLKMFNTVDSVFVLYVQTWILSKVFNSTVEQFRSFLTQINLFVLKTETQNTGVTALKKEVKATLITSMIEIVSELKVFFKKEGDTINLANVNYTKSSVDRLRQNSLITRAKDVLSIARKYMDKLTDYKISEEQLASFESTIAQLNGLNTSSRVVIVEGKTTRMQLDQQIIQTNNLLTEELDIMMVGYAKTSPDFYNAYFNARKVVQYGIRHDKDDPETPNEGPVKEE
jgi:hypothetical protein